MAPGLDKLNIIKFRVAAYDTKSQAMAFVDPTRKDDFINISGTQMRRLAKEGSYPPAGFMAPKAWNVLAEFYLRQIQSNQEFIENWLRKSWSFLNQSKIFYQFGHSPDFYSPMGYSMTAAVLI